MSRPLITVIIPSYDRAHLLGETLQSIMAQKYQNWECIVVDDGSHDYTEKLMEFYCERDQRIKFYRRPKGSIKGANSCRNLGFSRSTGDYIIWFDSDDIMTPDHIGAKVTAMESSNADFVIARTANFEGDKLLGPYVYEKKPYGIKAGDFVLSKIHWYTYDVLLKRKVADQISWNERMKSWQDYNYFCKMLLITENGIYLDKVLTRRRLHSNSIQKELLSTPARFQNELLENRILTFRDIQAQMDGYTKREMIYALTNHCFALSKLRSFSRNSHEVFRIVWNHLGAGSAVLFATSILAALLSGKGYALLEKAKKRKRE